MINGLPLVILIRAFACLLYRDRIAELLTDIAVGICLTAFVRLLHANE